MKALIALLPLFLMGVVESSLEPTPNGRIAPELPPLPPLISLGLGMTGERDAAPIVGACAWFAQAGFMGGDRIVSVNGTKVRTVDDVRVALAFARPNRSIEFELLKVWNGKTPETAVVEFPPNWWLAKPKRK